MAATPAPRAPAGRRAAGGGVTYESLPLGRILGVHVGLNWSLLIIFWLVAWSLAESLLPDRAPGASTAAYWGAALIATLLFYVSLLAHELAHSVLARRRGMAVEGITLWLFGGVSRLHGEPESPGAELLISVVGPLTSLAAGLLFGLVGLVLEVAAAPPLIVAVPVWLAAVNGLLAVFNLLPAFPLDGGRVLHAMLWSGGGDRTSATVIAARVGTWFGWLLGLLGVAELLATGSIGGLWLIFLGWFLVGAARAEATRSVLHDALRGVHVADVMSREPVVVPDWVVLQEFLDQYALQHPYTAFPVRDFDGRIDGLIALSHVKTVPREQRSAVRVRDVMWTLDQVPVTRADEPLTDLLERMNEHAANRALVFDADRLVGIVSPNDVSRAMQVAALRSPSSALRPGV